MPSPLYYQNNHINNFAIRNPIRPQPGNVRIQVKMCIRDRPYAFFEYDGLIYWNCDGDPEALRNMGDSMIPLVVTARWDGQALSLIHISEKGMRLADFFSAS